VDGLAGVGGRDRECDGETTKGWVGVMVKASEAMSARVRARQAKAQLDAQRAEQDRLIVDAATEFYEAGEALVAAQAGAVAAEERRTKSVARLLELGQTDDEVAVLCGIAVKEVRELRRLAAAAQSKPAGTRQRATSSRTKEQVQSSEPDPAGDAPAVHPSSTAA
jgi:hypothetical protein